MLFTEPLFFAFFLVVFLAHWAIPGHRARKILLLVASYAFYAAWDWKFLFLILASTLVDFLAAPRIASAPGVRARKLWLLLSLCANLGMLGFFKYFNFFIESTNELLSVFGVEGMRTFGIILPIGISFYTFQTMSYSIDVYRRRLEPVRDFWDFALFVGFFPQLVMGPILRAKTFLPQLPTKRRFRDVRFKPLLTLFLIGFVKKACVSDNIAPLVDTVYADPASFDVLSIWIACMYYAVQLYCDFSGYTDMAIAVAGMLGYHVALNFDFPLLARDVSDFWRRWHISFSSWLRDYLYFPLGGSRGGRFATHRNLMITMLLSGLWHGAGMHFVVWGGLNGVALIFHKLYLETTAVPALVRRFFATIGIFLTFWWFAFTLIYFRSQSTMEALGLSKAFVFFRSAGRDALSPWTLIWFLPLLLAHVIARRTDPPAQANKVPDALFAIALGIAIALAVSFVRTDYRPFIYFQF